MDNFIIATQTGGILRPFALILGKILEGIYDLGIHNIGFCIIIFTFVKKSPAALHVIQQRIFAVTIRLLPISPLILQR
jgi:hypothetical protein